MKGLRFKKYSGPYYFFQFVVIIYSVMLFDNECNPDNWSEEFKKHFDFNTYFIIQTKFTSSFEDNELSTVSLSSNQVSSLFGFIDIISKALLTLEEDKLKSFKSAVKKIFPDIK